MLLFFSFFSENESESDDTIKAMLTMSRDQLLLGLGDESDDIK